MTERVKLSHVQTHFEGISYPVTRDDAATAFSDTTLLYADGEANLGELISEVGSDTFTDPEDLFVELQSTLPVEAVGEPGQSDGDA